MASKSLKFFLPIFLSTFCLCKEPTIKFCMSSFVNVPLVPISIDFSCQVFVLYNTHSHNYMYCNTHISMHSHTHMRTHTRTHMHTRILACIATIFKAHIAAFTFLIKGNLQLITLLYSCVNTIFD